MGKLEKLLSDWQEGALRTAVALGSEGYSMSWLDLQRKRGSLVRFAPNIVGRPGDDITAFGGLFALSHDLGFSTYIGGLGALQIHGLTEVKNASRDLTLFGSENRLPGWFISKRWKRAVSYKACRILFNPAFSENESFLLHKHQGFSVRVSSPLRAIFEYLHYVPREYSLKEAQKYVAALGDVPAQEVVNILLACRSFKVKRLFLLLSDKLGATWRKQCDLSGVELGDGYQAISPNGVLNEKYKLYLPKSFI